MHTPMIINNPPNIFNAEAVHGDLDDNRDLWQHVAYVYQTVGVYNQADCEIENVIYYLVVAPGREDQLIALASRWKPGRLEWASREEQGRFDVLETGSSNRGRKILKAAWVTCP